MLILRNMKLLIKIITGSPSYIYTVIIGLAICWLTLAPKPLPECEIDLFPGADKIVHAIMFGAFGAAIYVDTVRMFRSINRVGCAISTICVSAVCGGIIELLQSGMQLGRSAETADFVADCAGAVAGSLLAWIFFVPDNDKLKCAKSTGTTDLRRVSEMYHEAFPPEEQRPWNDILDKIKSNNPIFSLNVIYFNGNPVGLITFWNFNSFVYIEHFAVDSAFRGKNIGSRVLKKFCRQTKRPVVLEVEPSTCGEIAKRRIEFYNRIGFHSFPDFKYIQPPYDTGLPPVELMLMSTSDNIDLQNVTHRLHSDVYGKN